MTPAPHPGDFVSDREIARRWGVSEATARTAIRAFEMRHGFPQRDPLMGNKRYWPAVRAFMDRRYGVKVGDDPGPVDGEVDPHAAITPRAGRRTRTVLAPAS